MKRHQYETFMVSWVGSPAQKRVGHKTGDKKPSSAENLRNRVIQSSPKLSWECCHKVSWYQPFTRVPRTAKQETGQPDYLWIPALDEHSLWIKRSIFDEIIQLISPISSIPIPIIGIIKSASQISFPIRICVRTSSRHEIWKNINAMFRVFTIFDQNFSGVPGNYG